MIALAMVTVGLVLGDKEHFGWLVGTLFLEVITGGVVAGALVVLIGAWNLPERARWQGITLIVWALIALTSPAFGILFLLPWGVLALMLPVIIAALITLFRGATPAPAPVH
ncbi:MAG TPA: hypothetical protein VJ276_24360 [Thermoanaerobaculia bacterium]|nr:hypothetical protein [Thermoanaerobaculia bacterium]